MGCGAIKWGFGAFYQDQGLAPFFSIKDHLLECVIAIFIFVVVLLLFEQTQLFKIRFTFSWSRRHFKDLDFDALRVLFFLWRLLDNNFVILSHTFFGHLSKIKLKIKINISPTFLLFSSSFLSFEQAPFQRSTPLYQKPHDQENTFPLTLYSHSYFLNSLTPL